MTIARNSDTLLSYMNAVEIKVESLYLLEKRKELGHSIFLTFSSRENFIDNFINSID